MTAHDTSTLRTLALSYDLGQLGDVLVWLCLAVSIFAAAFPLRLFLNIRRMRWLTGRSGPETVSGQTVQVGLTVIIPARNEEEYLEACVRSILDQKEIDLEVVVVNDHSTDRTRDVADELARTDPRVRVIHDPPVEPGWLGKPNAMQKALETVSSEYILFSDADIVHSPGCIAAGLAEVKRRDLGLVTLMPTFEFQGIWEHVLVPGYLGWMALNLSRGVEDPESKAAAAAGAFLLVRSDALKAAGGLEAIRSELVDDVKLAARFKEHRIPIGFYFAPELLRVRMFKSGSEAFWGMTKNVLAAAPGGILGIILLAPVGMICHATPPVVFGLALFTGNAWLLGASVFAYASQYFGLIIFRRLYDIVPVRLLFFPLNPIPTACCICRALYHRWVHGAVLWRGRSLRVGK